MAEPTTSLRAPWPELLAVCVGGALGTGLRLGLDALVQHELATLTVNVLGAFVLALLVARVWPHAAGWLRAALGAGLLGAFTTFSAVAASLVDLASDNQWMPAAAYLAANLVLGFGAAALGLLAGRPGRTMIDLVDE